MPARLPGLNPGDMASGRLSSRAGSWSPARRIWPGRMMDWRRVLRTLLTATGWSLADCVQTVTANPAALGTPAPSLKEGEPANLVLFRHSRGDLFQLAGAWIDGQAVAGL